MSDIIDLMNHAKIQVALRAKTLTHRIKNKVWYNARKTIRNLPKKAVSNIGGLISMPIVPFVINTAVETAINSTIQKRRMKKQHNYSEIAAQTQTTESLRKAAKSDCKCLKTVIEKIDENHVKLKDARNNTSKSLRDFYGDENDNKTVDHLWNCALSIYEQERYEDKLMILHNTAKSYLESIEKYIIKSQNETDQLEIEFIEDIKILEEKMVLQLPELQYKNTSKNVIYPMGVNPPPNGIK
jgi:hypothetical protein